MNVAASSIAPAAPASPSSASGAQSAADEGSSGGFANVMQAVQPKEGAVNTGAAAQPKTASTGADTLAALLPVAKSPAHIQSATPKFAKDANEPKIVNAASDETSISNDAKDVLSPIAAHDDSAGAEPERKPLSAPTLPASAPAALQPGSDPVPQAAVPEVAMEAAALTHRLSGKQLDGKAVVAANDKSAKRGLHAHQASADGAVTPQTLLHVAGNQAPLRTGEVVPAASAPELVSAGTDGQAPPDTTAAAVANAALKPLAVASLSPHAVPATKGSGPTVQKVDSSPAVQPTDATPAATQLAGAHGTAATQTDAPQGSSAEERGDASWARNVFAGAPALSAAAPQAAAMFVPSLTTQAVPAGEHRASTDLSSAAFVSVADSTPDGAIVQAAFVKRLEIAVNDPLLGTMDVRAEMRGGALHASLIGTQDTAAASMPALHQFLQQHDVTVHTLTYSTAREGVAATGSTTSSSSDMGRETADRSFGGGTGTGSQQPQGDGSQPQGQRYGTPGTGYDEQFFVPAYAPRLPGVSAVSSTLPTGSTLSIHI